MANAAYAVARDQALRDVLAHLRECDVRQDHAFLEVLVHAIGVLELSDQEVADGLLVSRPTVNRWRNGKNLPHPALRRSILGWFGDQAGKKLRLVERSA
jgi:transcriptional regulator with XRE-family HTH domain